MDWNNDDMDAELDRQIEVMQQRQNTRPELMAQQLENEPAPWEREAAPMEVEAAPAGVEAAPVEVEAAPTEVVSRSGCPGCPGCPGISCLFLLARSSRSA